MDRKPWSDRQAQSIGEQHQRTRRELRPCGHRFSRTETQQIKDAMTVVSRARRYENLEEYLDGQREVTRIILESYRSYSRKQELKDAP